MKKDDNLYLISDFTKEFGVSRQAIREQLKKHGLGPVNNPKRGQTGKYDEAAHIMLIRAYKKSIAKQIDVSDQSIKLLNSGDKQFSQLLRQQGTINELLTEISHKLDADTTAEIAEHVAKLLEERNAKAAYEYAGVFNDTVAKILTKVDGLETKIDKLIAAENNHRYVDMNTYADRTVDKIFERLAKQPGYFRVLDGGNSQNVKPAE